MHVCYTCQHWRPLSTNVGRCGRHYWFFRLLFLQTRNCEETCSHWAHVE